VAFAFAGERLRGRRLVGGFIILRRAGLALLAELRERVVRVDFVFGFDVDFDVVRFDEPVERVGLRGAMTDRRGGEGRGRGEG